MCACISRIDVAASGRVAVLSAGVLGEHLDRFAQSHCVCTVCASPNVRIRIRSHAPGHRRRGAEREGTIGTVPDSPVHANTAQAPPEAERQKGPGQLRELEKKCSRTDPSRLLEGALLQDLLRAPSRVTHSGSRTIHTAHDTQRRICMRSRGKSENPRSLQPILYIPTATRRGSLNKTSNRPSTGPQQAG